ncbi:MAG: hypothetical protein P4L10_06600 [Acidobacteriaceae bacterium]|nr:hypothetical protein [Acidobacteriaceae bacterium]
MQEKPKGVRGGCQYCPGRKFIRSGFRGMTDFIALLKLHYPVRCRRCSQRQYVDFLTACMALSAASRGATPTKARENWRSWTAGSDRAALEALQKKHDK